MAPPHRRWRRSVCPRPAAWSNTSALDGPAFRSHEYNPTFVILRQSGCTHYEKPFLYVLFGAKQALLFDTGAPGAELRPDRRRPAAAA